MGNEGEGGTAILQSEGERERERELSRESDGGLPLHGTSLT